MQLKNGVILAGLHPKMRPALIAAEQIWNLLGRTLVITSGLDGCHSAGSLHYYGRAIDCRTNYFSKEQKQQAANNLRAKFNKDYDVVIEKDHIHIEYDPKDPKHPDKI